MWSLIIIAVSRALPDIVRLMKKMVLSIKAAFSGKSAGSGISSTTPGIFTSLLSLMTSEFSNDRSTICSLLFAEKIVTGIILTERLLYYKPVMKESEK
jgi:hypothetical protein